MISVNIVSTDVINTDISVNFMIEVVYISERFTRTITQTLWLFHISNNENWLLHATFIYGKISLIVEPLQSGKLWSNEVLHKFSLVTPRPILIKIISPSIKPYWAPSPNITPFPSNIPSGNSSFISSSNPTSDPSYSPIIKPYMTISLYPTTDTINNPIRNISLIPSDPRYSPNRNPYLNQYSNPTSDPKQQFKYKFILNPNF